MTCCLTFDKTIHAYEKKDFEALEFEKSIVFNPTKISANIKKFIKNNNIKNPFVSMSISGPNIFEKIVTLPKSFAKKEDFKIADVKNLNWNHTYLCPSLKGGFDFYICGMKREHLFQYKLLALWAGAKLAFVTTEQAALISLYKHLEGQNFIQSQFSVDLSQNGYDMQSIFTPKLITKNFNIAKELNINVKKETKNLATSIGLFLLGNKIWKI